MPTVIKSVEIPAAPDAVWAKVTDLGAYGEWNVTHTAFPDGTPELATGAQFREKVSIMGMPGEVTWTVAELQEGSKLALDGTGPMGIKLRAAYELAGNGATTTMSMESSFEGGAISGPMGSMVEKQTEKAAEESLSKLAALV